MVQLSNSPFIILVASRTGSHISMAFNEIGMCKRSILLDDSYRPSDDIRRFVIGELARVKSTHPLCHRLPAHWPSDIVVNTLIEKSPGQFIYAATVMRFVADSSGSPEISMEKVSGLFVVKTKSPFAELDSVYSYILSQTEEWETVQDVLAAQAILSNSPSRYPIQYGLNLHDIPQSLGYSDSEIESCLADLTSTLL